MSYSKVAEPITTSCFWNLPGRMSVSSERAAFGGKTSKNITQALYSGKREGVNIIDGRGGGVRVSTPEGCAALCAQPRLVQLQRPEEAAQVGGQRRARINLLRQVGLITLSLA